MTDEEQQEPQGRLATGLRDARRAVAVRPSPDLWDGVQARIPRERRRRLLVRRVAPALAAAAAVAGVLFGAVSVDHGGDMRVVPAGRPPSPTGTAPAPTVLRPMSITGADQDFVLNQCATGSSPRPEVPGTQGALHIVAAVRDTATDLVSVLLAGTITLNGPGTGGDWQSMCTLQLDGSGDLTRARQIGWGAGSSLGPARDPIDVSWIQVDRPSTQPRSVALPGPSPAYYTTAGRVGSQVSRLTATTIDGQVIEVPVQNGYFVAATARDESDAPHPRREGDRRTGNLTRPLDEPYDLAGHDGPTRAYLHWRERTRIVLRAYDAGGRLIGEARGA